MSLSGKWCNFRTGHIYILIFLNKFKIYYKFAFTKFSDDMVFHEPDVIFLQEYLIWWLVFHDIACVLDYL